MCLRDASDDGSRLLDDATPKQAYREILRSATVHPLLATRPLGESTIKPLKGGGTGALTSGVVRIRADKMRPYTPLPMGSLGDMAKEKTAPDSALLPMGSLNNAPNGERMPHRLALTSSLWMRLMSAKSAIAKMELTTRHVLTLLSAVTIAHKAVSPLARLASSVLRTFILQLWVAWSSYRKRVLAAVRALIPVLQQRITTITST